MDFSAGEFGIQPQQGRVRDWYRRPLDAYDLSTSFNRTSRDVKVLQRHWRRAIVGLLGLAEMNLHLGRQKLVWKGYESVLLHAAISVENAARALIYCYGGRPNVGSGKRDR